MDDTILDLLDNKKLLKKRVDPDTGSIPEQVVDINQHDDLSQDGGLEKDADLDQDGDLDQDADLDQDGDLDQNDDLNQDGDLDQDGELDQDGDLDQDADLDQDGDLDQDDDLDQNTDSDQDFAFYQDANLNIKQTPCRGQDIKLTVKSEYNGVRIDKYLSEELTDLSRSYIQKLIADNLVLISNKPVKANLKVKSGQAVTLYLPEPKEPQIVPEDLPLDIIYEDKDIVIINKHKGMVVHPAAGHSSGTLVNALLHHCQGELSGINGIMRPGIVHRIDRDTTGVMVACKNDKAHQCIAEQLKVHSITRRYQALVYHPFKLESGRVEAPIGRHEKDRKKMAVNHKNGKNAATNYKVIENLKNQYAFIECSLETGRTHQIRVHMASIHHPLLGDTVYGPEKDPFHLEGQALHAGVLGFIHPTTKEYVEFSAPLPRYFTDLLEKLRG